MPETEIRIGKGNPILGQTQADNERCLECHGRQGISEDLRIPNHAGQFAGYLIKQLQDFKSGKRQHEIMTVMAEDLGNTEIIDIASYFSSRTIMSGEAGVADTQARQLFTKGDASRDIPACASCHGESGKGRFADNVFYPLIGGQRKLYLRTQLVNWKLGERNNSPQGVMNKIAQMLTDEEIGKLADYLSGL